MLTGVRFGGIFFGNFDHDRAVRLRPVLQLTGRRAGVETTEQEGTSESVRKMKNLKRRVRVGFLIALALVGGVALTTYDATQSAHDRLPRLNLESLGDRVLIIAPHPDDEVLACGGLIAECVRHGKKVRVVFVTTGDGYRPAAESFYGSLVVNARLMRSFGVERHAEAVRAARVLGLTEKQLTFLCFPDGGINSLWGPSWERSKPHQGVNGFIATSYPFAFRRGVPYCGEELARELADIVRGFRPSAIFFPDAQDAHHDHWATSAFVQFVLAELPVKPAAFTYLVHRQGYPYPWMRLPHAYLSPSRALLWSDAASWRVFDLSREDERRKEQALARYVSQVGRREPFFEAFVRKNELFRAFSSRVVREMSVSQGTREPPDRDRFTIVDLPRDGLIGRYLFPERALRAYGLACTSDTLYVRVETDGAVEPARPALLYGIHLRFPDSGTPRRLDILVFNGRAFVPQYDRTSLKVKPSGLWIHDSSITIALPRHEFQSSRYILCGCDILSGTRRTSLTGWSLFEVAGNRRGSAHAITSADKRTTGRRVAYDKKS